MANSVNRKILVVDDDPDGLNLLDFALKSKGWEVVPAAMGNVALETFQKESFDLVLLDLRLPDIDGLEVMKQMKEISPETEVIIISGYSSVDKAVEATKEGAFYFIEKPIDLESLFVLVEKALSIQSKSVEIKQLRDKLTSRSTYEEIVGKSKAMQNVYQIIDSVAPSDANVLIIGESGTGKELIANAIHYRSNRAKKSFVKVNCAALPKELIESELFGHIKGSFTGAINDKTGLIAQAENGSLLLDEIGEMPLELQPKMLRVLQERVFTKIGGTKPQEADFRLISATNRDPHEAIQAGNLREDLYYRISTITIRVPPLRERAEDLQLLAEHFRELYSKKYNRQVNSFSNQAFAWIFSHHWKGNVRELQNAVERAVLLCKGGTIELSDLPVQESNSNFTPTIPVTDSINFSLNTDAFSWDSLGETIISQINDDKLDEMNNDIFEKIESSVLKAALDKTKQNKKAAANLLGIYRPRLYGMIKKYNLE
jgi:DNA-binding NtrC family response regulator